VIRSHGAAFLKKYGKHLSLGVTVKVYALSGEEGGVAVKRGFGHVHREHRLHH
jgi:hypothetical protein